MADLVVDTFTDTNGTLLQAHTPEIGSAWVSLTGPSLDIQNNAVDGDSSSYARYYNNTVDAADVAVTISNYSAVPFACAIIARLTDANNYYYYSLDAGVWKNVAGVHTKIIDFSDGADGLPAELRISGSTISAYYNGAFKGSVIDTSHTTGKVGFGLKANVDLSNFAATVTLPPPTPNAPTDLTATCQIENPVISNFTSEKDRETIDKIEGLLTVEDGSTTVTGFGTKFTEDLEIGSKIVLNSIVYEVDSITNDTELELTVVYDGASDSRIEAWIPVTVTFTNTSIVEGNATYFWDFGDGQTSTEENPSHTYTDGGMYEPTLKVYDTPPLTGTISVTSGSTTVEGSGTAFTTELEVGESIIINDIAYFIESITDDDTLVLTEAYDGLNQSGITAITRTSKLTGTIGVTNNSVTVNGSGTSFTTELQRGDSIEIGGVAYVIDAIVSDTELTLMNPYGGSTDTGLDCFKKLSRFDGAYASSSEGQAVAISGKGTIDINYLRGDFEISILSLSQLTGTIAVTNGTANIVGSGTAFTTELEVLEQIVIEGVIYTVYSIIDDTHITLTTAYTGPTDSGLNYYQKSIKMVGTVNVTNNSKTVIGIGTAFITDYAIGDTITVEGVDYIIDDVVSDLELILSSPYNGSTDTGLLHFRGNSSYTNIGTGPFILNLIDGTQGEVTEYLWDFGDGALVGKTGTISVTQGSRTIIGSGTLFTSELDEGDKIDIGGLLYRVLNIISDTELVLASYYAGDTDSGLAYSLKQPGTTSSSDNPELFLTDTGTYELTLEVVKDSTVYTTTKTIQVRATDSSPEESLSQFTSTQGTGAAPINGTVGATNGSTTVLGSATSFATELTEGGGITIEGVTYTIATIISDEELTLTQPYTGGTTTTVSLTGTLSVTNGSTTIVGNGTAFTTELVANQIITIEAVDYTVLELVSNTELILTYNYDGDTASALSGLKEEGVLTQGLSGYNGFIGLSALTGTVTVTEGSLKVIGTGTSFTTELVKNEEITIEGVAYTVIGILSDTELILSKAYDGDTTSGLISFLNSKSAPTTEAIEFTNFTEPVREDLTGTVSVINNSITVIGSGTAFTTELEIGQLLDIEGIYYTIAFIVSDTELELTVVYTGVTDSGLTAIADLVETYFWDFGDGTFSTEKSPTHLYSESGAFEATLTVTNKNGASSYYQTIESIRIDFYAIDIVNHRVGLYSFSSNGSPKLIRPIGRFGNGRAQFNSLNDLIIVGKGKKTLEGMEV
jgi:PKD repeat protein